MLIEDFAKAAGVSPATVSRVMNNRPGVSAAKAREIRALAKKLNFKHVARAGKKSANIPGLRVGTIALLQVDTGYLKHTELFIGYLAGVNQALAEHNLNMIFSQVNTPEQLPPAVAGGRVDGLLLAGSHPHPALLSKLKGLPAVWLTSHPDITGDQVMSGNEEAGRLAAEYLVNAGCRNLAYWNPLPGFSVFNSRGNAFEFAARQKGVEVATIVGSDNEASSVTIIDLDLLRNLMEPMVDEFMTLDPMPTGLFVPGDRLAAVLQPMLVRRGLRPGEDLKIISFGNEKAYLASLAPRPATIDIGPELIGKRAVEQLLWRIRYPKEQRQVNLSIQPVVVPPSE